MAKKQKSVDGGLSQSVTHLLHRVLQLALDYHAEASGPAGLTQRQYTVLAAAGKAALAEGGKPAARSDERLLELLPAKKRESFLKTLATLAATADGAPAKPPKEKPPKAEKPPSAKKKTKKAKKQPKVAA